MRKNSKFKIKNSKTRNFLNSGIRTPNSNTAAFLWDESFLWGLMAYNSLKSLGLSFNLVRSADIKKGCLENYNMLFVPGGWASNKSKALGERGIKAISDFVNAGGNYLGLCGGAGLATSDGIGLLNVIRKPTKDRVPSFSGRIYLNVKKHLVWNGISNPPLPPFVKGGRGGIFQQLPAHNASRITHYGPIFHAFWPSQFLIRDSKVNVLATFGYALPDAYSSDLNVDDMNKTGNWLVLEKSYQINLDPARLMNEPAVIEGRFGKGRVVLSLVHFDTPGDENGQKVLRNLWEYLAEDRYDLRVKSYELKDNKDSELRTQGSELIVELEAVVSDLIAFGERNSLWFWRNPMLLQWRRGVRGLEYCTLFVMIKEIAQRLRDRNALCVMRNGHEKSLFNSLLITDYGLRIRKLLIPFIEKAKQLLILERHAMQDGQLSPLPCGCSDPEIQRIRTELFSDTKSHGGKFKKLIDEIDNLLFFLLRGTENL